MLDYAIAYARQGYRVFPLLPDKKKPLTDHGFDDATTDERQIEAWWAQTPDANVGIATGRVSNVVVVDVDRHDTDGTASLPGLNLPPTKAVKTPRDGYHLFSLSRGRRDRPCDRCAPRDRPARGQRLRRRLRLPRQREVLRTSARP